MPPFDLVAVIAVSESLSCCETWNMMLITYILVQATATASGLTYLRVSLGGGSSPVSMLSSQRRA